MAYTTHSASHSFGNALASVLGSVGRAVTQVFESIARAAEINSTAHARLAQAERLHAKTDAELAELGLKRHEIAHHVFRDLFWN